MEKEIIVSRVRRKLPARVNGFSLVEVALALGVVSFAMLGVLGLLPVALNIHHDSMQRQLAAEALQQASVAIQSQSLDTNSQSYSFSKWLTDTTKPISWKAGDALKTYNLEVVEGGNIRQPTTPSSAVTLQKLRVEVKAPGALNFSSLPAGPVVVKVSVAWPAAATWTGQAWQNASGTMDTILYALPY